MRASSFLGALVVVAWASPAAIRASAESEARSVQAGVFTPEQAERGAKIYEEVCVACHQPEEFSEGAYLDGWAGQKMIDLIEHIRATMPQDNPGSLKRADYVDVGVFLLKINGVPQGESEMDTDSAKEIVIEGPFRPAPDGK